MSEFNVGDVVQIVDSDSIGNIWCFDEHPPLCQVTIEGIDNGALSIVWFDFEAQEYKRAVYPDYYFRKVQ